MLFPLKVQIPSGTVRLCDVLQTLFFCHRPLEVDGVVRCVSWPLWPTSGAAAPPGCVRSHCPVASRSAIVVINERRFDHSALRSFAAPFSIL